MPKSSKRFVISDESVNRDGFWIKTDGVDLSQFRKNPVLLFMHNRPWTGKSDDVLALGHVVDLEVNEDKQITGIPYFDDNDPFAMRIYHKVEGDHYRMVSGGFVPKEFKDDEEHLKNGAPCLAKSELQEVSIVDFGANNNALAVALYDETTNELIKLSADNKHDYFKNLNTNTMSKETIELSKVAGLLGLKADNVNLSAITHKVNELNTTAQEVVQLKADKADLTKKLSDLKEERTEEQIEAKLDKWEQEGRSDQSEREELKQLAGENLEALEKLMEKRPVHKSVADRLSGSAKKDEENPLLKMSWDEAHRSGDLTKIKEQFPEHFAQLKAAKYPKK